MYQKHSQDKRCPVSPPNVVCHKTAKIKQRLRPIKMQGLRKTLTECILKQK